MNIKSTGFVIEMTQDEAWNTFFDLRNNLVSTLKTHWVNHQRDWQTNEKERLYRIERFATAIGVKEYYEDIFIQAKAIFEEWNEKKNVPVKI